MQRNASIDEGTKQTAKNTVWLYVLTAAKLIFPLLTLPYLTRILSKDCYGVVAYVKSCMVYMQLIVDFGFILSAVKDIVKAQGDSKKIGEIAGHVYLAKGFLAVVILITSFVLSLAIPLLRSYKLYVMLSAVAVALSALLGDFLFRGLEKMHVLSITYTVMQGIATALTFVFIKNDADMLWIPILNIIGTALAVVISWVYIHRFGIRVRILSIKHAWIALKESFVFFASQIATTAFTALNTILVGIFIVEESQIAEWSVCLQLVTVVQNLYAPLTNGIYPQMVRERNLKLIKKVHLIFMPIVVAGCVFCFFCAKPILLLVGGEKYKTAYILFRTLIPLMLISFPAMMLGWPTLGAIDKAKQVTISTVVTAVVQVAGLLLLAAIKQFTLINIAVLRSATELLLCSMRFGFVWKNRGLFRPLSVEEPSEGLVLQTKEEDEQS